ncbi:MAG TPA: pyridoxamine 5'-phosphate oxidase family protein, partial [Hyphomicrobiales bacterium]|nr:pyridoxamine 5'-phosphate oxidase family protein [Hyphomicrobiales bacterium]
MDEAELRAEILAFLDAHTVMSLATSGADGGHAASLMYARDGLALYWVSDPESRHSREIEADPRVAATIAPDYDDFKEIHGLQIHGRARRLDSAAARAKGIARLAARYPFLKQFLSGPAELVRQTIILEKEQRKKLELLYLAKLLTSTIKHHKSYYYDAQLEFLHNVRNFKTLSVGDKFVPESYVDS